MSQNRAQEVLYESEAALRLVDHELDLLRTQDDEFPTGSVRDSGELAAIVEQVSAHVGALRSSIHDGRSLLQSAQDDPKTFASLTNSILADLERRLEDNDDAGQSMDDQIFPEVPQPAA